MTCIEVALTQSLVLSRVAFLSPTLYKAFSDVPRVTPLFPAIASFRTSFCDLKL